MGSMVSFSGRAGRGTWWATELALGATHVFLYFLLLPRDVLTSFSDARVILNWYVEYLIFLEDFPALHEFVWEYGAIAYLAAAACLSVISLAVYARRWHDHGKSGWWSLVGLVPLFGGLYMLVKLGFMKGEQVTNQYGAPPTNSYLLTGIDVSERTSGV